jgi:hypothetical protein
LFCKRWRGAPVRAERSIVAKGASTNPFFSIPIGACKASIKRDLMHPLAVLLQHVLSKGQNVIRKNHFSKAR